MFSDKMRLYIVKGMVYLGGSAVKAPSAVDRRKAK